MTPRNVLTDTCRCGAHFDIFINCGTTAMVNQHDKWLAAHRVCRAEPLTSPTSHPQPQRKSNAN